MAATNVELFGGIVNSGATPQIAYTSPSGGSGTRITSLTVYNTNAATQSYTIYIVSSTATATDSDIVATHQLTTGESDSPFEALNQFVFKAVQFRLPEVLQVLLLFGHQALSLQAKFKKPESDLLGLAYDDKHLIVEWCVSGRVLFSLEKKGEALSCHFSSDKKGLRYIKVAINDFIELVRDKFPWCKMIIAIVKLPSVCRLIEKVEFNHVANFKEFKIYEVNMGFLPDALGFGGGGSDAAEASIQASETQASAQGEALEYLKKQRKLCQQEFRDKALQQYGDFFLSGGLTSPTQEQIEANPLYQSILGTQGAAEDAVLRHQAATGGFRSGDTLGLARAVSDIQRNALMSGYKDELARQQYNVSGLQSLAQLPSNGQDRCRVNGWNWSNSWPGRLRRSSSTGRSTTRNWQLVWVG